MGSAQVRQTQVLGLASNLAGLLVTLLKSAFKEIYLGRVWCLQTRQALVADVKEEDMQEKEIGTALKESRVRAHRAR